MTRTKTNFWRETIFKRWRKLLVMAVTATALGACGGGGNGGSTTYIVGDTVSGLTGTLVLQNNHGDDLSLSANGGFSFNKALSSGMPIPCPCSRNPAASHAP
jgi:hypothetical protein